MGPGKADWDTEGCGEGGVQGMVGRSELAAALAAAKARGEEAQAKADMVEGLEAQLARLREQLKATALYTVLFGEIRTQFSLLTHCFGFSILS